MKKYVKTTAVAMLFALTLIFTACNETGSQPPPKVEIIERSNLLNRIDMNYILPSEKVRRLAGRGLNVSFGNLMLSSDNWATFDLVIKNNAGKKVTLPMNAMLSYNHSVTDGQDEFSDIQLYWGDVEIYGDSFVVTNMSQPIRFSMADVDMKWEKYDTSFADGGYIVDTVQTGDNIAFLYYTENDEGIAVFGPDSRLISRVSFTKAPGSSNLADVKSGAFVPVQLQNTARIYENCGVLITEGVSHSYLYDYRNDTLYTGDNTPWKTAAKDEINYLVYRFENNKADHQPFIYMAVREKAGNVTDMQTFTVPVGINADNVQMSVNEHDLPVLLCEDTGMIITVDYTFDKAYTQFSITEDMLKEKLYTSKDKKYELYSYAHRQADIPAYHIALKSVSDGAVRYIGEIGMINGYYEGETGFAGNDMVYLLTGDNLKVYSTDMTAVSHTFALADYFPLGVISDNYDTRHLVSAAAINENSFAVVYYEDNLMASDEERFVDIHSKNTLKSVYKVAVFDAAGKLTVSYDTRINVICGWCPVHSYVKGDEMNISVSYKDTDHIFTKGTLSLSDGAFNTTREYKAPDKW